MRKYLFDDLLNSKSNKIMHVSLNDGFSTKSDIIVRNSYHTKNDGYCYILYHMEQKNVVQGLVNKLA